MRGLFCGNGSLLVQCAEAYLARGGTIVGCLTDDAQIVRWANANGVAHIGRVGDPLPGSIAFDDLLSIANQKILSADLIRAARRIAINFHDGPLPGRAGLNTPAWAILEGEAEHGITWHEMTEDVDAGRVLMSRTIPIRENDTAFSLNARCFEAGLETFGDLIGGLLDGTLAGDEQAGANRWIAGTDRPATLGIIDFPERAESVTRTVRALDFGTYPNPLCLPRIWTGTRLIAVKSVAAAVGTDGAEPGQILDASGDSLHIATGDGAVALSNFSDLSGIDVSPEAIRAEADGALPPLPEVPTGLANLVGSSEGAWRNALKSANAARPPFPMAHGTRGGLQTFELGVEAGDSVLAAAWIAWTAGLVGNDTQTIGLGAAPDHPALAAVVPVTVGCSGLVRDMNARTATALTSARDLGPMAADLVARLDGEERRDEARNALSIVLIKDVEKAPDTADIALVPGSAQLLVRKGVYDPDTSAKMAETFAGFLTAFIDTEDAALADLPLGAPEDLRGPDVAFDENGQVHALIEQVAERTPEAIALEAGDRTLTYAELSAQSDRLAAALATRGAKPGDIVGLCLDRSADLVIAMLAILKTGAAYLPLDPDYPADRIAGMIEDSGTRLIVAANDTVHRQGLDPDIIVNPSETGSDAFPSGQNGHLAYVIYTSGSTGRPKGVMVPHSGVLNFFSGMDRAVPLDDGVRLMAVTSVSFDISVLEILWTLSRGATVVLQGADTGGGTVPDFSLFYFASEAAGRGHEAYRLLLEGAKFADENGFSAVWTPERHFHAFGGLFPNPSVASAALSGITTNIDIRAGSCVLPLHHPVRVAEDWALVDNLSNGRAGIALASGWQPNDFLLRPEAFEDRRERVTENVETLRALWRGEARAFPGPDGNDVEIRIHPRPVNDDIPLWLTAAGNPETFTAAGRLGCGVLTHLLGQTFEEVAEKIRAYRTAWREAGHEGDGNVVLMLHTFIGESEEAVMDAARGPMKSYLKSAVDLIRRASWSFPTFVERAEGSSQTPEEMFEDGGLSDEEMDQLLEHAFLRYYSNAGLFGTAESAVEIVRQVAEIGADEVGCLIDFGIETQTVLDNLPNIKRLMDNVRASGGVAVKADVAGDLAASNITHLQCTPSLAGVIEADDAGRAAIGRLSAMLVGGEALPADLAKRLSEAGPGKLLNMYGPTETTIWSSVADITTPGDRVPLGSAIANTVLSVRSPDGRTLPELVEGELWIGGAGVTDGYWNRPDLTADRFVELPEGRFYRTGDLVRRHPDGELEFLGRMDGQVKIRGHRIELGEIETRLREETSVGEAVVRAISRGEGDVRLAAWLTAGERQPDLQELKQALARSLPEFMLPSDFMVVPEMPLTPNGKIDRNALPDPTSASVEIAPADEAKSGGEETIAAIWAELLGHENVPATVSFFDLGGHSLLVVQAQRVMNERLGTSVSITDLFRFPTVRAIAEHLSGEGDDQPSAAQRGSARAAARRARMGRRA